MSRTTFEAKYASSTKTYVFDFTSRLALGETVSSAVVSGTSYSAESGASISVGSPTVSSPRVSVSISGGTEGAVFLITCTATTSAGQILPMYAYLPVVPAGS